MAQVFYVRDGHGKDHRLSRAKPISVTDLISKLGQKRVQYSPAAPTINGEAPVNPSSAYRHVVIQIEPGEELFGRFSAPGFYLVLDFTVADCARMLSNP
jgi:hypothetical protein